ncbi:nuclear transport factor 2 family protein [Novosphingobium sp. MBES04]|uniref:nuclear transport factor 2 family protein n=1 Tax=Novosphingobium sp. MBES04 TaxID=1206458 RepID=UPI000572F729|nr:nuclear transport factor 2 family protein [Novosphingobium sp. MBES04]GAM07543.1 polyketide cyclase [Novosphingobium sp. MBES04]
MAIDLPRAIARYFTADETKDAERVAQCFTQAALVRDEGENHEGRAAIRKWKESSSTKYSYTVEPFSLEADADRIVVTSHMEGDFPGSPVDLRYFFVLEGEKISALEIKP